MAHHEPADKSALSPITTTPPSPSSGGSRSINYVNNNNKNNDNNNNTGCSNCSCNRQADDSHSAAFNLQGSIPEDVVVVETPTTTTTDYAPAIDLASQTVTTTL
ncbi:hypothetical protein BGZ80_000925 [Entomortierella chlamydospora]|uniref:Uncharacterized protein n=1 Tax=Entomortierella chlamydospora TaxID=101097 RepID=A0A9P6SY99_9FUNG|nr:hypothetical protein BGZ80_000925 [Entomortierella chlamydospora]